MSLAHEAAQLQQLLNLQSPPIAITLRSEAPAGVPRIGEVAPSGCTYWKLAAEGNVFYTEAGDHFGCPIGSYTHGIDLPSAQQKELESMIETMVSLNYLKMEEVPAIPRREERFGVAIYAPLAKAPFEPDVVIVRGNARQMMLLAEAANSAGVSSASRIMGRPTCAMIPAVMKTEQAVMSLGCIGNRVYNELGDGELYMGIFRSALRSILGTLESMITANTALMGFHSARVAESKESDRVAR